jgi:hypothetical protein
MISYICIYIYVGQSPFIHTVRGDASLFSKLNPTSPIILHINAKRLLLRLASDCNVADIVSPSTEQERKDFWQLTEDSSCEYSCSL